MLTSPFLADDAAARACLRALTTWLGRRRCACEDHLVSLDLEGLASGVMIVDARRRVLHLSQGAIALTGLEPRDALGAACNEVTTCARATAPCVLDGGECPGPHQSTRQAGADEAALVKLGVPLRSATGGLVGALVLLHSLDRGRSAVQGDTRPIGRIPTPGVEASPDAPFHGIVGRSACIRELTDRIRILSTADATVLVLGESGTGKELVARALHSAGPRAGRPFQALNCAALSEGLFESELFGHVRGAFTGAERARAGRLELAGDGTLFLDEIGCLPPPAQAKLLRVLESRQFERVGGNGSTRLQARIVAASNADLEAEVRRGAFREDLFYRLAVVMLRSPALREHLEDLPGLARHLIREATPRAELSAGAMEVLLAYSWPGNVRELRNSLDYALAIRRGRTIEPGDLPRSIGGPGEAPLPGDERQRIEAVLREVRFRRARAAARLGVSRTTLWRRMRHFGLA